MWLDVRARAMLTAMALLACGQGLLCALAPNPAVRGLSLLACAGAVLYAACLLRAASRR